jgi:hypothetical protein
MFASVMVGLSDRLGTSQLLDTFIGMFGFSGLKFSIFQFYNNPCFHPIYGWKHAATKESVGYIQSLIGVEQ